MASTTDNTRVLDFAAAVRKQVLHMVHKANASHVGSCMSAVDILAHLYTGWLNVNPTQADNPDRDRFILSKGHAAAAIYATLAEAGFFPKEWLSEYCRNGGRLGGHVTHWGVPGVELSTGALGHGLPVGLGMALAAKRDKRKNKVVVLLSDGECDEGSNWEAALMAPHLGLDNLIVIVDYNKIQSLGSVEEVAPLEPFVDKWTSFRWAVREIDGHNHTQIAKTLKEFPFERGKPSVILAHTVKGKGISYMENQLAWHYKSPDASQLEKALAEIDMAREKAK